VLATNTAATLCQPARMATKTNSPDVVQKLKLGSMWPSERTTSAPPRPPQNAATTKLIAIARRTEPPRYSTRSSFSRTASVTRPRVLSKKIRIASAAIVATKIVSR
jgi:hypothetical protein